MKALAFRNPTMVGHNATVWDAIKEEYTFEGKPIKAFGLLGSAEIERDILRVLDRYRRFDDKLLLRTATYEVVERQWKMLIRVGTLGGVFYLSRIPGESARLAYLPVTQGKVLVVSRKMQEPHYFDANTAQEALNLYLAGCPRKSEAA
jgi:hypothetical protein